MKNIIMFIMAFLFISSFQAFTIRKSNQKYILTGAVVNGLNGKPIENCIAYIDVKKTKDNCNLLTTISDKNGQFKFEFTPADSLITTIIVRLYHENCEYDKPFYIIAEGNVFNMGQRYNICN